MGLIALIIKLDSKGPVLFFKKRVVIYKKEFYILKYRSMYIDTPKNMLTHMLENPDAYITKVGKLLRKFLLDELPIDVKAKFNGECVEKLNHGGFAAFLMACKCFAGTILKAIKSDDVIEGTAIEKSRQRKF